MKIKCGENYLRWRALMRNIIIILAALIFSQTAFSVVVGSVKVEGTIISYSKHTVTLSQRGKRIEVLRQSIPSHFKIRGGNKVYAIIDGEQLMKELKKVMRLHEQRKNKAWSRKKRKKI